MYVGVTSDLKSRVWQHRNKYYPDSYSAKYNCVALVYFREFSNIVDAITEEKRIKAGNRQTKDDLINILNPDWKDLWEMISV